MLTAIEILDESYINITREATRTEWDGNDTYESHDIRGFRLVADNRGHSDLKVPFEIVKNRTYYLVYAIYDTGNSFHREEGHIDFVDLYESVDVAGKVAKIIEEDYEKWQENEKEWSVEIPNSKGTMYKFHCPWKGYFERLTSVHVESAQMVTI